MKYSRKKTNFKQAPNNPNISVNVSYEEKEMKEVERRILSDAFDPEVVKVVKVTSPLFSEVALVVGGCWHFGGSGVNGVRAKKAVEWVQQTANAQIIFAGDTLDVAGGVTKATHSKVRNQQALKYATQLLYPIRHKIIAVLGGNHDAEWANRNLDNQADFAAALAGHLDVVYALYSLAFVFDLPSADYLRKRVDLAGIVTHMNGRGGGKAASAERTEKVAIDRAAQLGHIIQLAFGAHYHANSSNEIIVEVPIYLKNGKLSGMQQVVIRTISESNLQENAQYAAANLFGDADSQVYFNVLKAVRNPLYKNSKASKTEQEYTLEVTRIPMFMQNSNQYTPEALEYMETFKEPDYLKEQVEKEYEDLSYEESMEKVNQSFSYSKPTEFLQEKENGKENAVEKEKEINTSKDEEREL